MEWSISRGERDIGTLRCPKKPGRRNLVIRRSASCLLIGQNVPFVTGQFTSSATGNNPFQTVERRDVGTTLTIKPLITQGDVVKLKIFQEVSRVLDSELSSEFGTVSTTKRSIESTVLVEDEQFVVLGGLIQDQDTIGKNKNSKIFR